MLLKVKSDLTLADGRSFHAGETIDASASEARLLLQKHSAKLEAVYIDKAKHAPATDKFARKLQTTQTK